MFNHSTQDQNVVWERDTERLIITYRALRDIPAGEELCKSANAYRCKSSCTLSDSQRYLVRESSYIQGRRCTSRTTARGGGARFLQLDSDRLSVQRRNMGT